MSENLIKVFVTNEEQQALISDGRYYIGVQTKIPTVIVIGGNGLDGENGYGDREFCGTIPPRLDPANQPYYAHPNVAAYQLCFVIFDITDHAQVPAEYTTEAADQFVADHYVELDHALRQHLGEFD